MPLASPSPPYFTYRELHLVRAPWRMVAVAVFLLYGIFLLSFRDGGDSSVMGIGIHVALRGEESSSGLTVVHREGDATERESENWDPMVLTKNAYGGARGPVKGGVEIYPLQKARPPRKAQVPLVPEVATIDGVLTVWKMPAEFHAGGGEAMKGIYVMFHGCNHGPLDWFDLPEERAIVSYLIKQGYAVVAPSSSDKVSRCWRIQNEQDDINPVKAVLWKWYRDWSIAPSTPLFLFGVSSGGNMATKLASTGGFQLCDKKSTYVQVSGILSQVSWGVPASSYGSNSPPIAFMPMPKGEDASSKKADAEAADVPPVFGNSRKIPTQIATIAHQVRKSGGRPRMLLVPLGELSVTAAFFSDRVYEISRAQSEKLRAALLASRSLQCFSGGGKRDCYLVQDPRYSPLALSTLETTYQSILETEGNGTSAAGPAAVVASATAPKGFIRRVQTVEYGRQQLQNSPKIEASAVGVGVDDGDRVARLARAATATEKPFLRKELATEVFRELLNVAWGSHEISADFVELWERWLWDSCGINCRPGPWRRLR